MSTILKNKLKTYVDIYGSSEDDKTIIYKYIVDNDLESEYIDLITKLSSSKISKLENQKNITNVMLDTIIGTMKYLLRTYPRDIALFLVELNLYYAKTYDFSYELIQKAKEIIPTINRPKMYFNDIVVHLNVKYGIKFKDHIEGNDEVYFNIGVISNDQRNDT